MRLWGWGREIRAVAVGSWVEQLREWWCPSIIQGLPGWKEHISGRKSIVLFEIPIRIHLVI